MTKERVVVTWNAVAGLKLRKSAFYLVTALHATVALSFVPLRNIEG
jgi:hypothetical protein